MPAHHLAARIGQRPRGLVRGGRCYGVPCAVPVLILGREFGEYPRWPGGSSTRGFQLLCEKLQAKLCLVVQAQNRQFKKLKNGFVTRSPGSASS